MGPPEPLMRRRGSFPWGVKKSSVGMRYWWHIIGGITFRGRVAMHGGGYASGFTDARVVIQSFSYFFAYVHEILN